MEQYKEKMHKILRLESKKIKIMKCEKIWKKLLFTIKGIDKYVICPMCKGKTDKRQDCKEHLQKPTWKHLYLADNLMIELKLIRRYFRCANCGSHFMEKFNFETNKWNHTKTFEHDVLLAQWWMNQCEIAKKTQCSPKKIHDLLHNVSYENGNKQWLWFLKKINEHTPFQETQTTKNDRAELTTCLMKLWFIK